MNLTLPDQNIALFEIFGEDFDRFAFPAELEMFRVTAGHGGESFLIVGSEKTALYDCGMAYCGETTAENIVQAIAYLNRRGDGRHYELDYILLSHSHYDHIGALPYILDRFPGAVVCASSKCQSILKRENARKLIRQLGEEARDLYIPDSGKEIRTDNFRVDKVLHDGDMIDLGDATVTAYETKGHTDCSLSYYIEPAGLLLASESTGILEGKDYVHTPALKSFPDSIESSFRCEALHPAHICLPHFGMIPGKLNAEYFTLYRDECKSKMDFVKNMVRSGLSYEEMLDKYIERYWSPIKESEQPFEAFRINSGHILNALIRAIEEES